MAKSGCCHRLANSDRGFTLLELIVVVALIAATLALVGPAMFEEITRSEERAAREGVLERFGGLAFRSFQSGKPLRFEPQSRLVPGNPHLAIPDGWAIEFRTLFWINMMGVCSGGRMAVIGPQGDWREYDFQKPHCDRPIPVP